MILNFGLMLRQRLQFVEMLGLSDVVGGLPPDTDREFDSAWTRGRVGGVARGR